MDFGAPMSLLWTRYFNDELLGLPDMQSDPNNYVRFHNTKYIYYNMPHYNISSKTEAINVKANKKEGREN